MWSGTFKDASFLSGLDEWLSTGTVIHDLSHVRPFRLEASIPARATAVAKQLSGQLLRNKAILGVFDEGCMGMYSAILDEELLNPMGIYK